MPCLDKWSSVVVIECSGSIADSRDCACNTHSTKDGNSLHNIIAVCIKDVLMMIAAG